MKARFIIAGQHGMMYRLSSTNSEKLTVHTDRVRTISESEAPNTVKSTDGSGYDSDTGLTSSADTLNVYNDSESKKTESFFPLFCTDTGSNSFQKKTVTIMEPNGHKVSPFKPLKKEKTNDGNKKIVECSINLKSFLDISAANLTLLSKSISKLAHLTQLYIYGNKISKIPKEIGHLVNLKELWMQENDIHWLPLEMRNCKNLRHLDVRHNHLGEDCLFVIKHFVNLEILLFNNNKLTRLNGIGRLKKLKTLSVKSNKLEGAITKSLFKLHNLVSLDLSKNKIVTIPDEIGQCTELQRFNVEYNMLTELPESIGNLQKLECIGIKYNQLEKVPLTISDCVSLKEFNIESNLISDIADGIILKLQQAIKINISHNKFTGLPAGCTEQYSKTEKINAEYNQISNLSGSLIDARQLRVLNLCYNNLSTITSVDISNLNNLVDLNISFNHLKELPKEVNQLTRLESLDLTNNVLCTLPRQIGELKCLRLLNLESNGLISLPDEMGQLDKLKNLNISCNLLKIFPRCLTKLKSLEMLNISENLFQAIPEAIGNLDKLTHLFLKDNRNLNDLPINIASMKSLTFLSLNGCPLDEIPSQYSKSPTTVVAYLRALQIGLRLHQFLKITNNTTENNSLVSSDQSINQFDEKKTPSKSPESLPTEKSEKSKKIETCTIKVTNIRPRSSSASAASKQQHLNTTKSRKSVQKDIAVPDYLLKKMKTTEAGFLACSK